MPVYPFQCSTCECDFTILRAIADRNAPAACPTCGSGEARRVVSAPHLALMSPHVRDASFRNERSRHEPRVTSLSPSASAEKSKSDHTCRSGCGCGSASIRKSRTLATPLGTGKVPKRGARPWMLGH